MPKLKLKTHTGAKARFGLSGRGKFLQPKGHKSHLRTRRSKRAKRQYDEMAPVHKSHVRLLKRALPYGIK